MNKSNLLRRVDQVIRKANRTHDQLSSKNCEPKEAVDLAYETNEQLMELAHLMQDLLRAMD